MALFLLCEAMSAMTNDVENRIVDVAPSPLERDQFQESQMSLHIHSREWSSLLRGFGGDRRVDMRHLLGELEVPGTLLVLAVFFVWFWGVTSIPDNPLS